MSYFDVDWSPRFSFGGPRPVGALRGVCIHTTENDPGTPASAVADYQIRSQSGSYHMLVDSAGTRLRENTDDWITWSSGNQGNNLLLHISFVFRAHYSRAQWLAQEKMLRAGAEVVAYWCSRYDWPVKQVGVGGLPGITTHDATRAWGGTDHTDPGPNFPWDVFLGYVREAQGPKHAAAPIISISPRSVPFNAVHEAALNDTKLAAQATRDVIASWDQPITSAVNPKVKFHPRALMAVQDLNTWSMLQVVKAIAEKVGVDADQVIAEAIAADRAEKK
ncbi:N-acetylmuramoyl-L-alanine amidase [Corynebacterium sp. zg-331]|uniref:N-acetylmuramoyl-L-alanine amidase n=1 Tax=unclassified Corynebacterium TaxID=2624378 RepID=UPI00128C8555|nr:MULTISPECIES: N-acetylmuramoyl-L-alanine amidase [unclassified Corynebacterium]MBC3186279.1 N-acetylmuramoyl-L-alanine amidase [Corynebacterium sp. zg-331]MPV52768.1 N-acetylmuramoyl-L-alanine amidase [Corynebacterium sp. zg331]